MDTAIARALFDHADPDGGASLFKRLLDGQNPTWVIVEILLKDRGEWVALAFLHRQRRIAGDRKEKVLEELVKLLPPG